jgi:cobalt-zinc-cadmium efflux system outer membrane protein
MRRSDSLRRHRFDPLLELPEMPSPVPVHHGRTASCTIQCLSLGLLVAATGCVSTDAHDELAVAASLSRRVTATADPNEVWALPVEGESPAWNGTAPLGYDQAVAVALQSNPMLRRTLAVIRERRADYAQAPLPPNPTIGFGVGVAVDSLAGAPAMVQGMQMLSWLWKNPHRVDAAEAGLKAAVYSAAEVCVDLMARTRTQVAAVLAAQQLLDWDREHEAIARHSQQLVHQQVEAGELAKLDLDRATIDYEQAVAAVINARHALLQAKLQLLGTMGRPTASIHWTAVGHLPPEWAIPNSEADLLALASTGRLDVAAAGQQVLRVAANLGLADTKRYPEVAAMLGWQRNFGDRKALVPGAEITLPLWDNGDPAIAKQHARLDAARLDLLAAQESAQQEVRTDLSRLRNARAQVANIRNRQLLAAKNAQQRSDAAYKAGEANLNTVLDTQRRRIMVERSLVKQSFEVMRSMCALRKAVGGSFDATLDDIPAFDIQKRPDPHASTAAPFTEEAS